MSIKKLTDSLSKRFNSQIKVIFVTATGIYPQSLGGPAVFLHYLSLNLRKKGVYIRLYDFSSIEKLISILNCITELMRANVIIYNSPPTGILFPLLLLSWIFRKASLFICHGGIFFERKDRLSKIERALLLLEIRKGFIKYVIFPSRWLFNFLRKWYKINSIKSIIIPNGVDVEEISSYPSISLPTKNNILFVGRLVNIKGISVLLDAFSQLVAEKSADYNLYIIGPCQDLSLRERIKKMPHVHYLGACAHSQEMIIMKSVDIIVVPSLLENFPLVVLEAMACAKPVIARASAPF